jgi:2'-hydroxyisoflavone reductase
MLNGIKAAVNSNATFTWVPADVLAEQKIRAWRDMTVWIPPMGATAGFMRRDISKAVSKGLTYRPLAVTARETLAWNKTRPADQLQALAEGKVGGISAEREKQVLDAWKARKAGH